MASRDRTSRALSATMATKSSQWNRAVPVCSHCWCVRSAEDSATAAWPRPRPSTRGDDRLRHGRVDLTRLSGEVAAHGESTGTRSIRPLIVIGPHADLLETVDLIEPLRRLVVDRDLEKHVLRPGGAAPLHAGMQHALR